MTETRRHGILRCPKCGLWRSWHSWKARPNIDRECIKCGHRIRVQLDRKKQGRETKIQVKELPGHMPGYAILKMLRAHNKWERQGGRRKWLVRGGSEGGFTRASRLDHDGTPRTHKQGQETTRVMHQKLTRMTAQEWDEIQERLEKEVGDDDEDGV